MVIIFYNTVFNKQNIFCIIHILNYNYVCKLYLWIVYYCLMAERFRRQQALIQTLQVADITSYGYRRTQRTSSTPLSCDTSSACYSCSHPVSIQLLNIVFSQGVEPKATSGSFVVCRSCNSANLVLCYRGYDHKAKCLKLSLQLCSNILKIMLRVSII